ncbi:PKD domain-containing protein [Tenacibaculum sp. TC6]|uniref:PKD domain-containing protein n=1 Tax=Tenacibaculum sp. TC6 TaxID=3423223 RepID=UPI003D36B249
MKKYLVSLIIAIISIYACVNEVALPVYTDFDTEVVNNDFTAPVKVKIINNTDGADTYKWTFEGGVPETSTSKNPGIITYANEGEYIITLEASNRDGSIDIKTKTIEVKPTIIIDFDVEILQNNFSPVEVKITNKTKGALAYDWFFQGGNVETSAEQHPQNIVFTSTGEHTIRLKVSNGQENYTLEKKIEVKPRLEAKFDYSVAFEDDDYQIPVKVTLTNKSVSATAFQWSFEGANIVSSSEENLEIDFITPGVHIIKLKVTNGKEEKEISKTIEVYKNTNLRSFQNIKLGINTAHKENKIGAFFSTKTRKVYKDNEITDDVGRLIDLVFFGLNESFSYNKFVSPIQASTVAFSTIPNAQVTKFINSLEKCNCSIQLSENEFDTMTNDSLFSNMMFTETNEGLKEFNDIIIPRIIPFETSDKRKGAIKIKQFVKQATSSYILVDIKIQKEAN